MKKIAVVTATRAEYGLLTPVIKELRKHESSDLQIDLIVTGTHLSEQYGMTIKEISEKINHKIPISVKSDTELDISETQAEVLVKFTELFLKEHYNAVLLLGDRYETLAIAIAAGNTRTPIFHLCGGDTTEGAIDEWIRHSITKISYLHFVTNEVSRKRVIQLGESPERVFNFGSTSVDNILTVADMSKDEALNSIGLNDCNYVLCTYHPVTMESGCVDEQISEFLSAIQAFSNLQFVVTKSNADQGGAKINELLDDAAKRIENLHVYTSLGVRRYLSLMKYAEFVLGNSSSGTSICSLNISSSGLTRFTMKYPSGFLTNRHKIYATRLPITYPANRETTYVLIVIVFLLPLSIHSLCSLICIVCDYQKAVCYKRKYADDNEQGKYNVHHSSSSRSTLELKSSFIQ